MLLALTDSGLGGLSICAALERRLRTRPRQPDVRLLYVNAWPDVGAGYNDLPDMAARASAFDRVLAVIERQQPSRLIIACNTLSIIYDATRHRSDGHVPVQGIIHAGVSLFHAALVADPSADLVLIGTRTTIESGVHRQHLVAAGLADDHILGIACPGLATAIERDARSPEVVRLIEQFAAPAGSLRGSSATLYLGFCCTHYGFVADLLVRAFAAVTGRRVVCLDPNTRLVDAEADLIPNNDSSAALVTVDVWSKVPIDPDSLGRMATLISSVSPATATALSHYRHDPCLF